ncbi:hypothetical protein Bca52824_023850 [Brassica carinata]|uniref:Uncharacterized protein n=1 Tax=Brassica carinata TaxID=52824 RepID=A0A8X8AV37_BRACI|nr:hypothetical protein Bca52824_023850 [Brassica carinata]
MEKISEKIHHRDDSSSDDEKKPSSPSSLKSKVYRLFGRKRTVHALLVLLVSSVLLSPTC